MRAKKYDINEHIRASVALSMIPDVGAGKINRLFKACPSPMTVFSTGWQALTRIKGIGPVVAKSIHNFKDWENVDKTINRALDQGYKLLGPHDSHYPELLKHIYDPPVVIWVKGNTEALKKNFIGVIGTRNPTSRGREVTQKITQSILAALDVGIVSGLAYGVDTAAHRTTIENGGCTVAILGSGLDNIYPRSNRNLASQIIKNGGAVLSEYPPGTKPESHHFPVRNRIVSGMSLGVVITETRVTGGSRITLNTALDQGREVFIIPHDIRNNSGRGCNEFIRNGWGKLICDVNDIADELPQHLLKKSFKRHGRLPDVQGKRHGKRNDGESTRLKARQNDIITFLKGKTEDIDIISASLSIPANELLHELLELELAGRVTQKPGKRFTAGEW